MTKDEALQMCLEYIETDAHERKYVRHAIKAALEAKDEPVAYVKTVVEALYENSDPVSVEAAELLERITTPPQRTWVALTDEEAQQTFAKHNCTISTHLAGILARAIEAKLKEKNT
jgi:ketosteroid isomerase-like protein